MAAAKAFGTVRGGSRRQAGSFGDDQELPRLGFGLLSSGPVVGHPDLRLCDGRLRAANWSGRPMIRSLSALLLPMSIPTMTPLRPRNHLQPDCASYPTSA